MELFLRSPDPTDDDMPAYITRLSDGHELTCNDYVKLTAYLCNSLLASDVNHRLGIDWSRCRTHPLTFLVTTINPREINTYHLLIDYFHHDLLPALAERIRLPSVTVILSMRRNTRGGMLVHVLNVQLSHDDYVSLCHLMNLKCCRLARKDGDSSFFLSCPSLMCLVASDDTAAAAAVPDTAEPKEGHYVPVQMISVTFPSASNKQMEKASILLNNASSTGTDAFFSRLQNAFQCERLKTAICLTMPVPQPCALDPLLREPVTYLKFSARIVAWEAPPRKLGHPRRPLPKGFQARFISRLDHCHYLLVKDVVLSTTDRPEDSFAYWFLKKHGRFVTSFFTENQALDTWYRRFSASPEAEESLYEQIERRLVNQCPHLKHMFRPLRKLLECSGVQVPVYYALHNMFDKYPDDMAAASSWKPPGVLQLPPLQPSKRLSFQTIFYCAFKTTETTKDTFFTRMGTGWDWIFSVASSPSHIARVVQTVQRNFFPIVRGRSIKEEDDAAHLYSWDPLMNQWYKITDREQLKAVLTFVYDTVTRFEGFDKMPQETLAALRYQPEWIDCLVDGLYKKAKASKSILFSYRESSDDDQKLYGLNVPEYYMLEKETAF